MTNSQRYNPLDEVRNPKQNRIRYQRRIQEEREAKERMREELEQSRSERDDDDPIPKIP